jgi:hypothetical protein
MEENIEMTDWDEEEEMEDIQPVERINFWEALCA